MKDLFGQEYDPRGKPGAPEINALGYVKRIAKRGISPLRTAFPSEYNFCWQMMKNRCINENDPSYHNYGGRGIIYVEEWEHFENFVKDMGPKPEPRFTIERVDNDGNYCKTNCRWATRLEQVNNQGGCKLNQTKANEIRELYRTGAYNQPQLAKKYDVSQTHLSRILLNKSWI